MDCKHHRFILHSMNGIEQFLFTIFFLYYMKILSVHLHSIRGDFSLFKYCLVKMFLFPKKNRQNIIKTDASLSFFSLLDVHQLFVVKYFIKSIFHLMVLKFKSSIIQIKVIQYPIKMDCKKRLSFILIKIIFFCFIL